MTKHVREVFHNQDSAEHRYMFREKSWNKHIRKF